jgi:hypothetical protein
MDTHDNPDCKLVIHFSENGKRKQKTVKMSQEKAQAFLDVIHQKFLGSESSND